MSQTSLIVKMVFQDGKRAEALAAFDEARPSVMAEEGTLVYSLHLDAADENTLWVFELYRDGDALAVHGGSDALKQLFEVIGPMLAEPPAMSMATPADGSKGLPS